METLIFVFSTYTKFIQLITNDKIFIKIIYFNKFVFAVTDALPSYSLMSLIISEPGRADDKPCQCIVAKPDLLVVEPEELTTEYKRTSSLPKLMTDLMKLALFNSSSECFSESEDEGILEIQLQIEELITELKRTAQPTQVVTDLMKLTLLLSLKVSVNQKTESS